MSAKLKRGPSAHYALILVGLCLIWPKLQLLSPWWMFNITKLQQVAVKPAFHGCCCEKPVNYERLNGKKRCLHPYVALNYQKRFAPQTDS